MNPLRVMSFNIRLGRAMDGQNRWYRRRELVFELIRRSGADLMGLQEVSPFQLDELLREFPDFGAIADRRYGGRWTGTYAPIVFDARRLQPVQSGDFWLSGSPDGRRARGWDAAVPRICTWAVFTDRDRSTARFAVCNSHFDQAGALARAESAKLVLAKLAEIALFPRLMTADLNADEQSEPVRILIEAGFRDSYRLLQPDGDASTYHGFRGRGVRSLGKIDYVMCDERWDVRAAEILREPIDGRYASDHFAVTAELVIKG